MFFNSKPVAVVVPSELRVTVALVVMAGVVSAAEVAIRLPLPNVTLVPSDVAPLISPTTLPDVS